MNVADWFARNRLELQAAGIIAALFAVGIILVDGPMIPVAAQDTETPPTFPVATVAAPDSLTVPPVVLVESGAATSHPQRLDSYQATPTTNPMWAGPIPAYRPGAACTIERATILTDAVVPFREGIAFVVEEHIG